MKCFQTLHDITKAQPMGSLAGRQAGNQAKGCSSYVMLNTESTQRLNWEEMCLTHTCRELTPDGAHKVLAVTQPSCSQRGNYSRIPQDGLKASIDPQGSPLGWQLFRLEEPGLSLELFQGEKTSPTWLRTTFPVVPASNLTPLCTRKYGLWRTASPTASAAAAED